MAREPAAEVTFLPAVYFVQLLNLDQIPISWTVTWAYLRQGSAL